MFNSYTIAQTRKLTNEVVVTVSDDEREERVTPAEKEQINQQLEKAKPIKYLPDWQLDPALKDSHSDTLPIAEADFFNDLIETYLKPYDVSPKQKVILFVYLLKNSEYTSP